MSGVLPSAQTTGNTIPYLEAPVRAPKDGVEDEAADQFKRETSLRLQQWTWTQLGAFYREILPGRGRGITRVMTKELALMIMDLKLQNVCTFQVLSIVKLTRQEIDRINSMSEDD